ncbi:MAG: 30S ribosomal protein S15, partial [Methanobacteriota archaeon]
MARLHAHRKGKSGSTRPYLKANPEWVGMEKAEIEETIVRLYQEGLSTASIGVRLRDAYGVPNVRLATGRSVTQILSSKGTKF